MVKNKYKHKKVPPLSRIQVTANLPDVFDNKFMAKNFDNKNIVVIFDNNFFVMKNTIGVPARKENFYPREKEINKIISKIDDGNNLQIAAPRRVGKTSILFSLLDNKTDNHIYIYVDTESIDKSADFFKRIVKEVIKIEGNRISKLLEKGNRFLKKIKGFKVMGTEISLNESVEADYKEELENLLSGFEIEDGKRLVLLIDEFPQTIQNIIEKGDNGSKEAINFLQSNRDLRLNPEINSKVTFIYTGSIGLNHTVSSIDGTAFINDINSVEVGPLEKTDALELLEQLLANKKRHISTESANYLMDKIEWLIPFHIQLAVQEIIDQSNIDIAITNEIIDKSFSEIVASRNNNHFEHYSSRLRISFKGDEYKFAYKLLCNIAEKGTLQKAEAFDISLDFNVQDRFRAIIEILIYDGYINNNGNANIYRFNSPILRMWWNRFNN